MRRCMLGLLAAGLLAWAGAGGADEKADAVLRKFREATVKVKSLEAALVMGLQLGERTQSTNGAVRLLKPNLGRLQLVNGAGDPVQTLVSDGKSLYQVQHG